MPNKIAIKKYVDAQFEGKAAGVITPGMLIEETSTGTLQAHSTVGGNVVPLVAKEQGYIGLSVDDDYAADDQVRAEYGFTGEKFYMWLAVGENVAENALLESAGDGTLQAHTPQAVDEGGTATYTIYTNAAKFRAAEAIDNSGGSEIVRILVEVV